MLNEPICSDAHKLNNFRVERKQQRKGKRKKKQNTKTNERDEKDTPTSNSEDTLTWAHF